MINSAIICYIACHGASADHFQTFVKKVQSDSISYRVFAEKSVRAKFEENGVSVDMLFSLDTDPEEIAKKCMDASIVITDVGNIYSEHVQKALARIAPKVSRFAYYDNPEVYVPGGYSATAAKVMLAAEGVLFANKNLANDTLYQEEGVPVDLSGHTKIGIGYYPLSSVEEVIEARKASHVDGKCIVYFGGNNEVYFSKAFPSFLRLIEEAIEKRDLSEYVIMLQQHPAAKQKNIDGQQFLALQKAYENTAHAPKLILSAVSSKDAQVLADAALYYQTSMAPQFVLTGIATSQIGHDTYSDVLIKNALIASITKKEELLDFLDQCKIQSQDTPVLFKGLGIDPEWPKQLLFEW